MGNTYVEKIAALTAVGGLVRTLSFDASFPGLNNPSAVSSGLDYGFTCDGGAGNQQAALLDTTQKASGQNSIKFTIASLTGSGSAGQIFLNFSTDRLTQFGAGQSFCVQWQAKWGRYMVSHPYNATDAGGFKLAIIGQGDPPGTSCVYGGSTGGCSTSHSAIEVVTQQYNRLAFFVQVYHEDTGAGGSAADFSDGFSSSVSSTDFRVQNTLDRGVGLSDPLRYCLYTSRGGGIDVPAGGFGGYGGCVEWADGFANSTDPFSKWATITERFTIGTLSGDIWVGCRFEMWWAWEGGAATKMYDKVYDQRNTAAGTIKYGKVWLLPYHTSKDASEVTDETWYWVANPIISTTLPALTTDEVAGGPSPAISSITPNTGQAGTVVSVSLTGTDFVVGATSVQISGIGVTVGTVTASSTTALSTSFTIAAGAATGARSVTVTTANGTSAPVTFTITPGSSPSPSPGTIGGGGSALLLM